MILRAVIPPSPVTDDQMALLIDRELGWDGETTGSTVSLDAAQFADRLRRLLNGEIQTARVIGGEENSQRVCNDPRFRNQAALTLWLEDLIARGGEIVELAEFTCPVECPNRLDHTFLLAPTGIPVHRWLPSLASAVCPGCGITYGVGDLREVEYDLFFCGVYVLTCPRDHRLFIVRWETYQLGG